MYLSVRDITKVTIIPALMGATAIFIISIPGGAPITLQTLFVLLSGFVLGCKLGSISMVIYIVLGIIGIPVFSGGTGGIGVLLGPTGGFIISFIFASFLVGYLYNLLDNKDNFYIMTFIAFLGSVVIYLIGIPWMMYLTGISVRTSVIVLSAYFPGDLIKIILAVMLSIRINKVIKL